MLLHRLRMIALGVAFVSTITLSTRAQESDAKNRNRNPSVNSAGERQSNDNSRDRDANNDQRQRNQSQTTNQNDRNASQGNRFSLIPEGWMTIGVDSNNDGFYDTFETIYSYDLVKAREASRGRSENAGQQTSRIAGLQDTSIQGEIVSLKTEQAKNSSAQRLVAEIKDSNGRNAQVCLGPKNKLSELNLQEGDTISAQGVLARKDNKLVLLASKVTAKNQTVRHKLTKRPGVSRLQGTLTILNEVESKQGDGTYLIAKIRTDDGTEQVHLGPKNQFSSIDLSQGDDIQVLTRQGKVSGKEAMVALEVSANGENVKVVPPQRTRQAGNQRDQYQQNHNQRDQDQQNQNRQGQSHQNQNRLDQGHQNQNRRDQSQQGQGR